MTIGDVVWVPFPHFETNQTQSRPAVLAAVGLAGPLDLCWVLMVTAATNPAWPEDVVIEPLALTGLPVASRIRTGKIATVPMASATRIGRLPDDAWHTVRARLEASLELAP